MPALPRPGEKEEKWLAGVSQKCRELAVYLAIGLGYLIGGFKIRGFSPGPVTGSLLMGAMGSDVS